MDKHRLSKAISALSDERGISRDDVITTITESIKTIARKKYKLEMDELEVIFDETTLDYKIYKLLADGDKEELDPIDFSRVGAQVAKQVIGRTVNDAARKHIVEKFSDRIGENTIGIVKRIERNGDMFLDMGQVEAIMPREHCIPHENYMVGSRVQCLIEGIKEHGKPPYVILSRSDIRFVVNLLEDVCSDLRNNYVSIESASRRPGVKTKIVVGSSERGSNPIGMILGPRGAYVQEVAIELNGERIDVIQYNEDLDTMVRDLLKPAEITSVIHNADGNIEVVVSSDEDYGKAVGKYGSNVQLAGDILECNIKILTSAQESEINDNIYYSFLADSTLAGISEEDAKSLYMSIGVTSLLEVQYLSDDELSSANVDSSIRQLSTEHFETQTGKKSLSRITNDQNIINTLLNLGIGSCDDLADLASSDIDSDYLNDSEKDSIVLKAREEIGLV